MLAAFAYWERCRLVTRTQDKPPRFLYLNVQQATMGRQAMPADEGYMQFAQALYAIFGEKRKLHGGETQLCYEWVEQLGIPREVVLLLVQHLATTRGIHFSFKDAQKLALELKERHIENLEDAEQFFARSQASVGRHPARAAPHEQIPRADGGRDRPVPEMDEGMGLRAQGRGSRLRRDDGRRPELQYLDSILRGVHERAGRERTSAEQLDSQLAKEKGEAERIREVLRAAGLTVNANEAMVREVYRDMLAKLPHETGRAGGARGEPQEKDTIAG